jgi:hypothetical protein
VTAELAKHPEIKDLDSGLPMPGIDWALQVDKPQAAKFGIGIGSIGAAVQLVTNGMKITDYRPPDSDKPVDIIVRVPAGAPDADQLDELKIGTSAGSVPISNFVTRVPQPRVGLINRVDGERVVTVTANLAPGAQTAAVQDTIAKQLAGADFKGLVKWKLVGSDEDRAEAQAFLRAPSARRSSSSSRCCWRSSIELSSVMLVLSAVDSVDDRRVHRPDRHAPGTRHRHDRHRHHRACRYRDEQQHRADRHLRPSAARGHAGRGGDPHTCRERARPVLLTAVTAVLGVLPIAFGLNVDFVHREITLRRALHAVVDPAFHRDRVRPQLLDHPDAGGDAGLALGARPRTHAVGPHHPPRAEGQRAGGRRRTGARAGAERSGLRSGRYRRNSVVAGSLRTSQPSLSSAPQRPRRGRGWTPSPGRSPRRAPPAILCGRP